MCARGRQSAALSTHLLAAASLQKAIYRRQQPPAPVQAALQSRSGDSNAATTSREVALLPGTARKPLPRVHSVRGTVGQEWSPGSQSGRLRLTRPAPLPRAHPPRQKGSTCKLREGQSADKPPLTQEDLKLPRAETQINHKNPQTQVKARDPESWRDPEEGFQVGSWQERAGDTAWPPHPLGPHTLHSEGLCAGPWGMGGGPPRGRLRAGGWPRGSRPSPHCFPRAWTQPLGLRPPWGTRIQEKTQKSTPRGSLSPREHQERPYSGSPDERGVGASVQSPVWKAPPYRTAAAAALPNRDVWGDPAPRSHRWHGRQC